jgi:glycosyltransferase involved in cell wall biosynthesis/GT2 family glycosyltransferase
VRLDEVEIGAPLPALAVSRTGDGRSFGSSLCLVRLHGTPLGLLDLELPPAGLPPDELAARIGAELSAAISRHLEQDGLEPAPLTAAGLAPHDRPRCETAREERRREAPRVSVAICTRDRPQSVWATVRSILGSRYPADRYEVIVVDNASSDDAAVDPSGAGLETEVEIRVVREPAPGLSHARNRGLREARGEVIVFADDDVEVDRDWLATLTAPFARDAEVGATSGLTMPMALDTQVEVWVEDFGARRDDFGLRVFDLRNPPADRPLFPFTVGDLGAGRNMAFRTDLLRTLGGFDVALGPGTLAHDGDDIEALLRVLLSGRRVVHDPTAIVWHAHPREYAELEQRVWGYGMGLTACLTRATLDHPGLLLSMLRKLPRGLAFALSPRSAKNVGRQADFPRELVGRELRGMAYGPVAYLRSRLDQRRRRRAASHVPSANEGAPAGLRILFVSDEYPPYIGGVARCLELFAEELARRGHTVAVATAWHPQAPAHEDDGKVAVHRLRDTWSRMRFLSEDPDRHTPAPFPDPEAVWRLRRLVRSFRPDIVPAYGWLAHSAAAALAGTRAPLVLWGHEYGNTCARRDLMHRGEEICSGPAAIKCLACASGLRGAAKGSVATASVLGVRPLLRRRTAAIHGVSRFVAEVMRRDLRTGSTPAVVIPNFHEEERDPVVDEEVLRRLPEEPFILFVGAFRRVKGVPELLAAYERLRRPPPLVMVGIRRPDTPPLPEEVTVLTDVPHATVMAMWRRSLFAVFPSTWPEPLATVVHEAMSEGRPVIATRVGGHVDMVDDGETGLLVEPRDVDGLERAMRRLIEDEGLRERLGATAAERAERFTPAIVVPQLEAFYRETATRAGARLG